MRLESKLSGADIWPVYNAMREAKTRCRPATEEIISFTDTVAEISLQGLLNYTANRISELQSEVILHCMKLTNETNMEAILLCSWEFDGSSSYSPYKQLYKHTKEDSNLTDENLFASTLISLKLIGKNGSVLWNNPSQSSRFCRPIKLEFVKESSKIIFDTKANIKN